MVYILIGTSDCIEDILFVSKSKKNSLAKFSEYKQIRDSEYEMYGYCDTSYQLREYPNDWEVTDCIEYIVIDKTE